ncbi:MAG TPA: hypothetical protein VKC64_16345 [Burkholderiales bacterium]|nr:hypothetical protein [Burkholderiales bacterium]
MSPALSRICSQPLIVGAVVAVVLLALGAVMSGVIPITGAKKGAAPAERRTLDPGHPSAQVAQPESTGARRLADETCPICGTVEATRVVEVERSEGKRMMYRVTVRMDDGSYRTLSQSAPLSVAVGERVRVVDGAVVAPAMKAR